VVGDLRDGAVLGFDGSMRVLGLLLSPPLPRTAALALGWGLLETEDSGSEPDVQPRGPGLGTPDELRSSSSLQGGSDTAIADQDGRIAASSPGPSRAANRISGDVILDPNSPADEALEDWAIQVQSDLPLQTSPPYGSHACALPIAGRDDFGVRTLGPHRHGGPLLLQPELGGLTRVHLEPPDPDVTPDKTGARHSNGCVPGVVVADVNWEVRGLDPEVRLDVSAESVNGVNPIQHETLVHPGEITDDALTITAATRPLGRVLSTAETPVEGGYVDFRLPGRKGPWADPNGEPHRAWDHALTDGHYRLLRVPYGSITVRTTPHDGAEGTAEVEALTGETRTLDLQLS
jgi:hypothetical protein